MAAEFPVELDHLLASAVALLKQRDAMRSVSILASASAELKQSNAITPAGVRRWVLFLTIDLKTYAQLEGEQRVAPTAANIKGAVQTVLLGTSSHEVAEVRIMPQIEKAAEGWREAAKQEVEDRKRRATKLQKARFEAAKKAAAMRVVQPSNVAPLEGFADSTTMLPEAARTFGQNPSSSAGALNSSSTTSTIVAAHATKETPSMQPVPSTSEPMRIFLSHKGVDKPRVRNYFETLKLLGFDLWLDEDAMAAGTNLHRGILKGMQESCAVVFFVTPHYVDDGYLATEIDYAIAEKTQRKDGFAIITLAFQHEGQRGTVPALLRPYVWKEPADDLEGLRVILRSLPVKVGKVGWRT